MSSYVGSILVQKKKKKASWQYHSCAWSCFTESSQGKYRGTGLTLSKWRSLCMKSVDFFCLILVGD